MPFNTSVTRGTGPSYAAATPGVNPLIPEDVQTEIIKGATNKSAALSMLKKRTMGTQQQRLPVLATKPTAYWVTGDTGIKQTTSLSWENLFLNAEEIAVNVPIPINVLEDSTYKLWDEVKPEVEEAIAFALDMAVFFGQNKPASWPSSIVDHAHAAGNVITVGTQTPNDIASELNAVMGAVEADGYSVNGFYFRMNVMATLRGLRATTGEFVYLPANPGLANTSFKGNVYGLPAVASPTGTFEAYDAAIVGTPWPAKVVCGQWDAGLLGVRQDVKGELFREGVITDGSGVIQFNLMQQDMVNMRFVARYAFVIANPPNRLQPTAASRSPFGILRDATN
jgi:HK97 family phage major capsid protein